MEQALYTKTGQQNILCKTIKMCIKYDAGRHVHCFLVHTMSNHRSTNEFNVTKVRYECLDVYKRQFLYVSYYTIN